MADLDRRGFLTGASLAAGVLAGCRSRKDPYAAEKPAVPIAPGVRMGAEQHVLSTCGMCDVGCGIRVRVVDGRAVKVEGNPESLVNRGGLCARGLAGLEMLYHPDRILGPMRRRGGRGDGQWEPLSWDDAISELAERLGKLRTASQAPGLVLLDGQWRGTTHALWRRFLAAFGSPNHVGHGATGRAAILETMRAMTGQAGMPSYDLDAMGCVLLVGTGALESSLQSMPLARALAKPARPRLYCVSPRLPGSAALVDEWFSIAPGGAKALLLGLLSVLLREQLADESPIEKARGFDSLLAYTTAECAPAQIERRTGIPAKGLEALARELVSNRPSVVLVDQELSDRGAVAAALVLNAVLSSVDVPGGMALHEAEPDGWGVPVLDSVAKDGSEAPALDGRERRDVDASRILAVPEAILSGKPYQAQALLLYYSNPVFSKPDGQRWADAVARVPFVASFSPILDESVRWSDLVLPDRTCFERWDILAVRPGVLSLQQPVVVPLVDRMQTGEVLLRVARALGGAVAASFPWKSYREAVLARLESWFPGGSAELLDQVAEKGSCQAPRGDTAKSGGAAVARMLDLTPVLAEPGATAAGDLSRFPFVLCPFRDRGYAEGGIRQFPWLAELPSAFRNPWTGYAEIAPEDAGKLGVNEGDWVALTSPAGRVELRAHVHSRIRPGAIGLPVGGWGRAVGDLSGTPGRLLTGLADPATGQWLAWGTRARVEKLG
jgi:menaquinone reductase, molybdopterin-binding-like subunit